MEKWFNVGTIVNTHGIKESYELFPELTLPMNVIKKEIHYFYLCLIRMSQSN